MDPRARWRENPFFVLGLPPDASRAEVERAAQRLLAELAVGRDAVRFYSTPLGPVERTPEGVRAAVAELRDPRKRLSHEIWAAAPASPSPREDEGTVPWSACARLLGLRSS